MISLLYILLLISSKIINKKMAINLVKGQSIDLRKKDVSTGNNTNLNQFCVGVSWGAVERQTKNFWGKVSIEIVEVDLDASCIILDSKNRILEKVFYDNLLSKDGAIVHSGDDRSGDVGDGGNNDNEVIQVNLGKLDPNASKIVFVLNSFTGINFAKIPFASIRIFEGNPNRVNSVFATFDAKNDPSFSGAKTMVLGIFSKKADEWKFEALATPCNERRIDDIADFVANNL